MSSIPREQLVARIAGVFGLKEAELVSSLASAEIATGDHFKAQAMGFADLSLAQRAFVVSTKVAKSLRYQNDMMDSLMMASDMIMRASTQRQRMRAPSPLQQEPEVFSLERSMSMAVRPPGGIMKGLKRKAGGEEEGGVTTKSVRWSDDEDDDDEDDDDEVTVVA